MKLELDKRIKSKSDILSCFDIENAKEFVGQKGYFANDLYCFSVLQTCYYDTLTEVKNGVNDPFKDDDCCYWNLFIPESVLKPNEKQYRAFTIDEFKDKFHIGQPISFRKKGEVGNERYLILNGYSNCKLFDEITTDIYIGRGAYTLDELFNKYEWQASDTEDFQPFGVAA